MTWQVALQDARRKLREAQWQHRQLRKSIEIIESKIAASEPWPIDSAAPTPEKERGKP